MSSHGGTFGPTSKKNLERVDPRLVDVAETTATGWNCTVTDGIRTIAEQKKNILKGVSKTMDSKHLPRDEQGELDEEGLAKAIDIIPYPTDWPAVEKGLNALKRLDPTLAVCRAYMFAGFVRGVAHAKGISVRQGVDWDSDGDVGDQSFYDLPHTELDTP